MSPMYMFVTLVIFMNSILHETFSLEKCITETEIKQDYIQFESNGIPVPMYAQHSGINQRK
ncbi:hypothetical protein CHS0354_014263 [Potamilus streckersoni]|uniref:Uncharacterized protein n=1 Tax=Potamilus streckersoni TaxID=2493646 RepID=A0AAE0WB56_9BIVA|nr:hypothetical protein CHS0354_014263 [Potamilus streckersoni]